MKFDDPLAGVVHLAFPDGVEVDVIVGKWKWELEILERSEPIDLAGLLIPVPLTSDLILLKLSAGGPIDLQDVIALLETDRSRLIAEVDAGVGRVLPDLTATWTALKQSLR